LIPGPGANGALVLEQPDVHKLHTRLQASCRPCEAADDQRDPAVERQIDKSLKQSFPASDPAPVNPGAD
jgi:hypothetical protein